ncbi:MAG: hypothetical protein ACOC0U_02645 [Desulfovibrionales bacterium]
MDRTFFAAGRSLLLEELKVDRKLQKGSLLSSPDRTREFVRW